MLLAYAGPASNIRLEQASRDCFTDGGALAEVISMFENMNEIKLADIHQGEEADETSQGNNCSAVEVDFFLSLILFWHNAQWSILFIDVRLTEIIYKYFMFCEFKESSDTPKMFHSLSQSLLIV